MSELRALPDQPAGQITTQASSLLGAAFVARAAALARDGHLDAAEPILAEALQAERSIEALDLLARIRAQQGRLAEADALWNEVLHRDATFDAAHAGLRRIRAIQTRRVAAWPFAVAVIVAAVILGIVVQRQPAPPSAPSAPQPAHATAPPPPAQPAAVAPVVKLSQIPGVIVRQENGDLVATFEAGLFAHGATLTNDGRTLLAKLGRELEPHASAMHFIIEGHCDRAPLHDRSGYKDSAALGLARSDAVFRYLRQATSLPSDAFLLRSLGSDTPPFAEEARTGETRNRTVVIRIRPRS